MDAGLTRDAEGRGGDRGIARKAGSGSGPPSSRLIALVDGDLPGHQRQSGDEGRVRFAPVEPGPVLEVTSRVEKRFLGRTEIAVFETEYEVSLPEAFSVELRHTGRLKRSGITAIPGDETEMSSSVAKALASDPGLIEASQPLDFTHFEVAGGPAGSRARTELMGASHVAVALPPIRSYVHLYPDQREALVAVMTGVGRVLGEMSAAEP